MKFKLLRYNNTPIHFNGDKIISITANGNLLFVKIDEHTTHSGYCICPL